MQQQNGAAAIIALIFLVLGAVFILTDQVDFLYNNNQIRSMEQQRHLQKAALSIKNWKIIHGNLPCPDFDQDGWLDKRCDKSVNKGWFPWKKFNLIEFKNQRIAYTLENKDNKQVVILQNQHSTSTLTLDFVANDQRQ